MKSTRDSFGETLVKFGYNEIIIVLDADLSQSTQTNKFAKTYPERFINVGCAEQNLIGIASGISVANKDKIVFASTYAIFAMRGWEQIRSMSHDNLNVKLFVSHSGLTNSLDGYSHQCLEDLAILRVIPNMTLIIPVDAIETEKVIENEIKRKGPAYIRLNRTKTPIITEEYYNNNDFKLGNIVKLVDGDDLTIISTGTMVHKVLDVADILKKEGISTDVINIHTIKPIDKKEIIKAAKKTGKIITVEEHSILGGLGSAVSEILGEEYPVPIKRIGMKDKFGESGSYEQLLEKYGLSVENIVRSAKELNYK